MNACLRDGRGGSPTAIVEDADPAALSEAQRRRIPVLQGTSHAVFVTTTADESIVDLRFFTAGGELPACGHGTVAAIAFLADRAGGDAHEFTLRASGRTFTGRAVREGRHVHAAFDPGPVTLSEPSPAGVRLVLDALGAGTDRLAEGVRVASIGRPRMLVPLISPHAVAALAPDLDRLRAACDRLGLLGCYVHSTPVAGGRLVARMFAPSIGVPEDIANANSTACLAAHLAERGISGISVDMGDALGHPATITASASPGPQGPEVLVGGVACRVVDVSAQAGGAAP